MNNNNNMNNDDMDNININNNYIIIENWSMESTKSINIKWESHDGNIALDNIVNSINLR